MEAVSIIKLSSLKPWLSSCAVGLAKNGNITNVVQQFKFEVCSSLNKKIYLCQGGISQLELDCVVLPVNEMTLAKSSLSKEIYQAAGCLLPEFYKNMEDIKTGNVVLGSGFDLPARYIIHAMEPGMNAKFKSAVENAVHRCYLNAMDVACENNLKTIGFVSLYDNVPYLFNEEMAHTALGTVRCYLEKHQDYFDAIVFSVHNSNLDLYLKLLCAYFPRTLSEAAEASHLLAIRNLGEWGEKIDADRAIRISHLSLSKITSLCPIDDGLPSNGNSNGLTGSMLAEQSFSLMDGDHDFTRLQKVKSMDSGMINISRTRIYRRLLCLAHTNNLNEISSTNSLYLSGCDRDGDAVAILVANRIKLHEKNSDKALLFFIYTLDSVVNRPYSLIYFHTLSHPSNHPSLAFVKRVCGVLDNRYKENLKRLFMVHPSFTSRIFTWFFASFTGSEVKRQIVTVRNIPQLYEHIAPDQIDVPPFVSDYDLKINHELYKTYDNPFKR